MIASLMRVFKALVESLAVRALGLKMPTSYCIDKKMVMNPITSTGPLAKQENLEALKLSCAAGPSSQRTKLFISPSL